MDNLIDLDYCVKYTSKSNLYGVKVGDVVRFQVVDCINSSFGHLITLAPFYAERDLFDNNMSNFKIKSK